jgi:hypothetical protein
MLSFSFRSGMQIDVFPIIPKIKRESIGFSFRIDHGNMAILAFAD